MSRLGSSREIVTSPGPPEGEKGGTWMRKTECSFLGLYDFKQ